VKRVAKWFNAITDAWNMGEASWAYDERGSIAVRTWCEAYDRGVGIDGAAFAVENLAQSHGIDLKRHKRGKRK
jgi:hypothetical protein